VTLNSLVSYEDTPPGSIRTVMLESPKHADEREGRVSTLAPLGRALLGERVGSIVDVPLANGNSTCVQVLAVRPGSVDAGDVQ
jgi:regulator of nucleoside diphosphate kinase